MGLLTDPLTIGGVFVGSAKLIGNALLALGCDRSVNYALGGIGAHLSLGRLDPNHDIARAARLAQLNASVNLLKEAKRAAKDAPASELEKSDPAGTAARYDRAIEGLRENAGRARKTGKNALAEFLPEGDYASVEGAVRDLLAAEREGRAATGASLAEAARAEAAHHGWPRTDAPPRVAQIFTESFASAFAASIGALLKTDDRFFRIWLILKAEATNANIEALLARFDDIAPHQAEREPAAVDIAGGEERLAAMEVALGTLFEAVERLERKIDAVPEATAERVVAAINKDLQDQLTAANIDKGVIIGLAKRIKTDIADFDQAVRELTVVVEFALDDAKRAAQGSNLGEFIDAALRRIEVKFREGRIDEAAAEADRAFEQWQADEADRRAEAVAGGLRLLEAGLRQDIYRRDPVAAAERVETMARLESGDPAQFLIFLDQRFNEFSFRGRNRGTRIDLEIAIEIGKTMLTYGSDYTARSRICGSLGAVYSILGELGDFTALNSAVDYYCAALEATNRKQAPLDWAHIQNNLGNTLRAFGSLGDIDALRGAVAAHEAALEEYSLEETPNEWAKAKNNLGNALATLGGFGLYQLFDRAVSAYEDALKVQTRERAPLLWADIKTNLGNALLNKGLRDGDAYICRAIEAYEEALEERKRESVPFFWAMTMANLGNALVTLGEGGNEEALAKAIIVYKEALEERSRASAPLQWAMTTANLIRAKMVQLDRMDRCVVPKSAYAALIAEAKEILTVFQQSKSENGIERTNLLLLQLQEKSGGIS